MYEDKIIVCKDCGEEFVFTAGEQEFYSGLGLGTEPLRCKECRNRRKFISQHPDKILYEIVCAECGKVEAITFEPRHDRVIYCSSCYRDKFKKGNLTE